MGHFGHGKHADHCDASSMAGDQGPWSKGVVRPVCKTFVPRAHVEATGKSKNEDGAVSSGKDGIDKATSIKLKQKELSELCKARGLACSGTKEVLANRLSQFLG